MVLFYIVDDLLSYSTGVLCEYPGGYILYEKRDSNGIPHKSVEQVMELYPQILFIHDSDYKCNVSKINHVSLF